ncbi:hypothetical protein, partial [Kocuria nitroreducens]|uniref:hypothetical protein n=1 Tax=Kocuria nitroreducens TaxID=3058914 RepID=UPI0036D8CF81
GPQRLTTPRITRGLRYTTQMDLTCRGRYYAVAMEPAEDVFTGPPMAPPPPMASRTSDFLPIEEITTIRHAAGYSPFLAFCTQHQAHPGHLASDFRALVAFLRTHASQFQQDQALLRAAAVHRQHPGHTARRRAVATRHRR